MKRVIRESRLESLILSILLDLRDKVKLKQLVPDLKRLQALICHSQLSETSSLPLLKESLVIFHIETVNLLVFYRTPLVVTLRLS